MIQLDETTRERLKEMFKTEGWRFLCEMLQAIKVNDIGEIMGDIRTTHEEFRYAQGRLTEVQRILQFQAAVEAEAEEQTPISQNPYRPA